MDPKLLRTFQVLCDKGTTQATAAALGISQSAVSRRLAQMEEELGLTLFVREGGRLIATADNRALRGQVSAVLAQVLRLESLARELGSGNSAVRALKVAFPASLTLTIVPAIIDDFLASHDRVQIELQTGTYDVIERMLHDDRAEIGFLRMPTRLPGTVTMPLIEVQSVCVLPNTHPLASGAGPVTLQELEAEPLILLGKARQPRPEIDLLFLSAGLTPHIRIEAHSVMSACALAARGLGITIVNGLMARDYAHLPIAIRPLAQPLPHHFAMAMPRSMPPSEAALAFIATAEAHFARLPDVRLSAPRDQGQDPQPIDDGGGQGAG